MTHVVCWDIDGTLLTTGRAGLYAWQDAVRDVCGVKLELDDLRTAGLTDATIAELLVERAGHPVGELGPATLARYEELLPDRLHLRPGRVLPGVVPVLDALAARDDALALLLTGNTARGAAAKLQHYGLAGYFSHGAFCEGPGSRDTIARRACVLAASLRGGDPSSIVIVGDTPHDVNCGAAVGALTVAVATGEYGVDELRAAGATVALEALPSPPEFLSLIGLADADDAPATSYAGPLQRRDRAPAPVLQRKERSDRSPA